MGKEERKREETNETRVSTFKPNKIYGIMNHAREICSGRCAHVFLLYICRRSNDEKGRMDVYVCVCICVLCAWREERTMSTADGSWGRNDVRLEPGLK